MDLLFSDFVFIWDLFQQGPNNHGAFPLLLKSSQHLHFMINRNKSSFPEPERRLIIALLVWCQERNARCWWYGVFSDDSQIHALGLGEGFMTDEAVHSQAWFMQAILGGKDSRLFSLMNSFSPSLLLLLSWLDTLLLPDFSRFCAFMSFCWFWVRQTSSSWKLPDGAVVEHLVSVIILFSDY